MSMCSYARDAGTFLRDARDLLAGHFERCPYMREVSLYAGRIGLSDGTHFNVSLRPVRSLRHTHKLTRSLVF